MRYPCPCCQKVALCDCLLNTICYGCFGCEKHCRCPEGFTTEASVVLDRLMAKKKEKGKAAL